MAKNLTNKTDVDASKEATAQTGQVLKIESGKTPVYFLSSEYMDGFIHWVGPKGERARVVCLGGLENKGWDPEACPICAKVKALYERARALEDAGKKEAGETIRKEANDARAKYEAQFIVAKGEMVKAKTEDGTKQFMADFDDAVVGILALTRKQYDNLIKLVEGDAYDHVKTFDDLFNRAIVLDKAIRGNASMATIEFIPSRHQTAPPALKWDKKDYDIEAAFAVDAEEVRKLAHAVGEGAASARKPDVDYEEQVGADDFVGSGAPSTTDVDTSFLDDVALPDPAAAKSVAPAPAQKSAGAVSGSKPVAPAPAPAAAKPAVAKPVVDDSDF
jgi:hypothetical protein